MLVKKIQLILSSLLLAIASPALAAEIKNPALLQINADDVVMGKTEAPVTIIEYASLSCTHCAHFHKEELPKLEEKYLKTGKAKLVLRQFPLNEPALKGAILLRCVDKTQYYNFNKVLFGMQEKWAFAPDFYNALQTIASVGGVNADMFDACMKNMENEKAVLLSRKQAEEELGIQGTPSFFINGIPLGKTAPTAENLGAAIDAAK